MTIKDMYMQLANITRGLSIWELGLWKLFSRIWFTYGPVYGENDTSLSNS